MTDDAGKPDLRAGAASTQSRNSLRQAEGDGLIRYRLPVELRTPESIDRLAQELGPPVRLVEDDAVYYWFYVPVVGTDQERAVLIPEGEVRSAMLVLAAAAGVDLAPYEYRTGVVPR